MTEFMPDFKDQDDRKAYVQRIKDITNQFVSYDQFGPHTEVLNEQDMKCWEASAIKCAFTFLYEDLKWPV
jgi:hypothetical protein